MKMTTTLCAAARATFAWLPPDPVPIAIFVGPDGCVVRVEPDGGVVEVMSGDTARAPAFAYPEHNAHG